MYAADRYPARAQDCTHASFDAAWYLSEYPDVAESGIDALTHYLCFGIHEGRSPRKNPALAPEHLLWRGLAPVMLPRLRHLMCSHEQDPFIRQYAAWALARWYALQGNWERVLTLLLDRGGSEVARPGLHGPLLLAIDAASRCRRYDKAHAAWLRLLQIAEGCADAYLAEVNVAGTMSDVAPRRDHRMLAAINRMWERSGLCTVDKRDASIALTLDNLDASDLATNAAPRGPLVTVIVPAFNAEYSIGTALISLFVQTYRNLEIIIVDDGSTDATQERLLTLCRSAPQHLSVRVLRHSDNRGTYAARNAGLQQAHGEFITTHDADDWSHPGKIASQVSTLVAQHTSIACLCYWARASASLHFSSWWVQASWSEICLSSLMVRRTAFTEIGYWDEVKVGADSEFYERLYAHYGEQAVTEVKPKVPLAFGRLTEHSLTQRVGATHRCTQYLGSRKDYQDIFRRWHERGKLAAPLYMPYNPRIRPFPAPRVLQSLKSRSIVTDPRDAIQLSGWFDPTWYLYRNIDLQGLLIDPFRHYWEQGLAEGRDPSPNFSTSGYLSAHPEVRQAGEHPLLHYLRYGERQAYQPRPMLSGHRERQGRWPTLLFCGHQADVRVFGAERALLGLLELLAHYPVNLVATLPRAMNDNYLEALKRYCVAVSVLPYGWWQRGRPVFDQTVRHFRSLIDRFRVDRIHVNTCVLEEPLHAGRQAGVPVWVHLRELPDHDPELCETLSASPFEIGQHIMECADRVLANSHKTAQWLTRFNAETEGPAINVFPNQIDIEPFLALKSPVQEKGGCVVGMISSNQPKKGLSDFERMAEVLSEIDPTVECHLVGPHTSALKELMQRQQQSPGKGNIKAIGYREDVAVAVDSLDILVNLSQVQESFGRTVLEAMAAARPVVAYDWGALDELIVHGATGYLAPYRNYVAIAHYIVTLASQRSRLIAMGQRGRSLAETRFGRKAQQQAARILLGT